MKRNAAAAILCILLGACSVTGEGPGIGQPQPVEGQLPPPSRPGEWQDYGREGSRPRAGSWGGNSSWGHPPAFPARPAVPAPSAETAPAALAPVLPRPARTVKSAWADGRVDEDGRADFDAAVRKAAASGSALLDAGPGRYVMSKAGRDGAGCAAVEVTLLSPEGKLPVLSRGTASAC